MAYREQLISTPYDDSRVGNSNFVASNRVGLIFTARMADQSEYDTYNPGFVNAGANATTTEVGFGYGPDGRLKIPKSDNAKNREILIGAGWRSVNVEQQHNVTQEGALGHYELLETVAHSVASNTLSADKMALRTRLLSRIGVAPLGKGVLEAPMMNCYIYDPKERQRGSDSGYIKCYGLTLASNRISSSNGSTMMESVSFKVDRFDRVSKIPAGLIERLAQRYPQIYTDMEQLSPFQYTDIVNDGANP